MWYGLFLIIIAVVLAAIGLLTGGAFLIILLPVGFIALLVGAGGLFTARRAGVSMVTKTDAGVTETSTRFGHESESVGNRVPATPEEHLKARQGASTPGVG